MKANELRIGNWVNRRSTGLPHKVVGLYNTDSVFIDIPHEQRLMYRINKDSALPIPLTPEILEKCGFKKRIVTTQSEWGETVITYYDKEGRGMTYTSLRIQDLGEDLINYIWESSHRVSLNYLHQLQNLFYCLTGEELNIEL